MSEFFKKEQLECFSRDLSKSLSKTSDLLEKIHIFVCFWQFFTAFPLFMSKSELLPSLFAPVAHYKRATVSKSLFRSFAHKNWAIRLKNQRANFHPYCQVAEYSNLTNQSEFTVLYSIAAAQAVTLQKMVSWLLGDHCPSPWLSYTRWWMDAELPQIFTRKKEGIL